MGVGVGEGEGRREGGGEERGGEGGERQGSNEGSNNKDRSTLQLCHFAKKTKGQEDKTTKEQNDKPPSETPNQQSQTPEFPNLSLPPLRCTKKRKTDLLHLPRLIPQIILQNDSYQVSTSRVVGGGRER